MYYLMAAFLSGALVCGLSLYAGFYLARLGVSDTPAMPSIPETYDGAVLDAVAYEPDRGPVLLGDFEHS